MRPVIKLFLTMVLMPSAAISDVTGNYTCSQKITTTIKMAGRAKTSRSVATTTMTVNADGTAIGINPAVPFPFHDTWTLSGKKFTLIPDQADVIKTLNYTCEQADVICVFMGDTYSSRLTVNSAQTQINGTTKLNVSMTMNGQLVNSNGSSAIKCRK